VRFVLCEVCSGSCKVYVDDEDEPEEEGDECGGDSGAGFRRCTECNENGIVRCPVCCC
jgi:glutaredoxin domain-containing cysteine-rich protein 1